MLELFIELLLDDNISDLDGSYFLFLSSNDEI